MVKKIVPNFKESRLIYFIWKQWRAIASHIKKRSEKKVLVLEEKSKID